MDVYDVDDRSRLDEWTRHEHIGYVEFTLAKLMSSRGSQLRIRMTKPNGKQRSKADVIIRGDELVDNKEFAFVRIKGMKFKNTNFLGFGSLDTAVELCKFREDGTTVPIARSATVVKNLDPVYPEFKISWGNLTSGNPRANVLLRVIKIKSANDESLLGEVTVTADQLVYLDGSKAVKPTFQIKKPKDTDVRGVLTVERMHVYKELSFLDFVKGGLDMRFMAAIDFTASNGNPRDSQSLHYIHPNGQPNSYESAIQSIGSIVSAYTEKPTFPAYGFGADVRLVGQQRREVSHCFPLTLDPSNPVVAGVPGILAAYKNVIANVALSGPTNFAELIQTASVFASEPYRPDYQHYTILLIVTDGMITDMRNTIDALVTASSTLVIFLSSVELTLASLFPAPFFCLFLSFYRFTHPFIAFPPPPPP